MAFDMFYMQDNVCDVPDELHSGGIMFVTCCSRTVPLHLLARALQRKFPWVTAGE
jgi:hypothetical protein